LISLKIINAWIICTSIFILNIQQAFASGSMGDRCSTEPGGHYYFCRGITDNSLNNIRELFDFLYYDLEFTIYSLVIIGFFITIMLIMLFVIKYKKTKQKI